MKKEKVKSIIEQAKKEKRWLLEPEAMFILDSYYISVPHYHYVTNEDDAVAGAEEIGYPIVLKIVSPDILHKSDAGCVKLNLKNGAEVAIAYEELIANAKNYDSSADIRGVMVYPMVDSGIETIIGVTEDAQFGSALMFGLGGIFVEILKDVVFRILPLSHKDALEMIKETKGYKLLEGVRGSAPSDVISLAETIVKVSNLCCDFPEIKEIDLNPTYVYENGVKVVDARMRIS